MLQSCALAMAVTRWFPLVDEFVLVHGATLRGRHDLPALAKRLSLTCESLSAGRMMAMS
jgi:hypothetical protein